MTLIAILILMVFTLLGVFSYMLYKKNETLLRMMAEFEPMQVVIGKVTPLSKNNEDFLASNPAFIEVMITFLEHRLALANNDIHSKTLSNEQIRFYIGQCDAYVTMRGSMETLLKRSKIKKDNGE